MCASETTFQQAFEGGTWGGTGPTKPHVTHSEKRRGMRDAPALLSHLCSPFVNDPYHRMIEAVETAGLRMDDYRGSCDGPEATHGNLKLQRDHSLRHSRSHYQRIQQPIDKIRLGTLTSTRTSPIATSTTRNGKLSTLLLFSVLADTSATNSVVPRSGTRRAPRGVCL